MLSRVVWIRSPWSNQIPDGEHSFIVGNVLQNVLPNVVPENILPEKKRNKKIDVTDLKYCGVENKNENGENRNDSNNHDTNSDNNKNNDNDNEEKDTIEIDRNIENKKRKFETYENIFNPGIIDPSSDPNSSYLDENRNIDNEEGKDCKNKKCINDDKINDYYNTINCDKRSNNDETNIVDTSFHLTKFDPSSSHYSGINRVAVAVTQLPYYLDDESCGSQFDIDIKSGREINITVCTTERTVGTGERIVSAAERASERTVSTARTARAFCDYDVINVKLPETVIRSHTTPHTPTHTIPHTTPHTALPAVPIPALPIPIPWILDICLDYFSTLNPFFPDLEHSLLIDIGQLNEVEKEVEKEVGKDVSITVQSLLNVIIDSLKFMSFRIISEQKQIQEENGKEKGEVEKDEDEEKEEEKVREDEVGKGRAESKKEKEKENGGEKEKENRSDGGSAVRAIQYARYSMETFKKILQHARNLTHTDQIQSQSQQKLQSDLHVQFKSLYLPAHTHYAQNFLKVLPYFSVRTLDLILESGSALLLPHHIRSKLVLFSEFFFIFYFYF